MNRRTFLAAGATAFLAACSRAVHHAAGRTSTTGPGKASTTGPTAAPTTTTAPVVTGPAAYVAHGPRTTKTVALTFHGSGDLALTNQLLDEADRLHVPVTIFAVGQWLDANPAMAKRILDAGHELANHTFTHPALASKPAATISSEIRQCRDVLTRLTGKPGAWFRPSGVESTPPAVILQEAGLAGYRVSVGFDVDPLDYQDPGADKIVARTAAAVQPGSIVSLHTGHAGTVAAFPRIVSDLQAKGLQPVTVSSLLVR